MHFTIISLKKGKTNQIVKTYNNKSNVGISNWISFLFDRSGVKTSGTH